MDIGVATTREGVVERPFTSGEVPGVLWSPDGADPACPLVLLETDDAAVRARGCVRRGFAAAALDDRRADAGTWQRALPGLLDGAGPVGFWGLGPAGGGAAVRLLAAGARIDAAAIGLVGSSTLFRDAAKVTAPMEFVVQWHDELVPRAAALALFDALGSSDKTLHAYPGPHRALPPSAITATESFFARHLRP